MVHGWCDREVKARRRLVRKEIAVRTMCWLIIAPALPLGFLHFAAEWLGQRDPPRWCTWLAHKADALAKRNNVQWM